MHPHSPESRRTPPSPAKVALAAIGVSVVGALASAVYASRAAGGAESSIEDMRDTLTRLSSSRADGDSTSELQEHKKQLDARLEQRLAEHRLSIESRLAAREQDELDITVKQRLALAEAQESTEHGDADRGPDSKLIQDLLTRMDALEQRVARIHLLSSNVEELRNEISRLDRELTPFNHEQYLADPVTEVTVEEIEFRVQRVLRRQGDAVLDLVVINRGEERTLAVGGVRAIDEQGHEYRKRAVRTPPSGFGVGRFELKLLTDVPSRIEFSIDRAASAKRLNVCTIWIQIDGVDSELPLRGVRVND